MHIAGKRILIVDDNASSREVLRVALEYCNYSVKEAQDGEQALAQIHESRPDLVLMDIQMPVMDGYAALREIRKQYRTLPVIAITAYGMLEDRTRAVAAGFDGYLAKPVNITSLRMQVQQLLSHSAPL